MKVAIVHDELVRRGGGEQVVLTLMKAYPDAHIYTSVYTPELTYPEFRNYKITSSLFRFIARNEKQLKRLFFPFGLIAMKLMRVSDYDCVIISSTYSAKYVSISPRSRVFIYTYTPFRLAWDPESYEEYNSSRGLKRLVFDIVVKTLRRLDKRSARKGRYFLGMTEETAQRIKRAYDVNEVKIIHPAVKCSNFYLADAPGDYYLLVSRLEFYKKVDLAVSAFNTLGLKLIVVGNGSKKQALLNMAGRNVEFRSGLSKEEIADLYAHCKAFIFPQHEDYGITPLEANASGRPVIAYGQGGVLETMKPFKGDAKKCTAVFFEQQTPEALVEAVRLAESLEFDPAFIRTHAEEFDEPVFIREISRYIEDRMK